MFSNGRGFVIVMLFLAGVINYLDRSALSVAAPFIQEDLNIRPAQMGMLFSSFSSDMPSLILSAAGHQISMERNIRCRLQWSYGRFSAGPLH